MKIARMAVNFVFLCCLSFSLLSGAVAMENQIVVRSSDHINQCYLSIQEKNYDGAYHSFIQGVNLCDATLGGFIFETIINGLRIFGYLKNFRVEDYGIHSKSIQELKDIKQSDVIKVFGAIYEIAHNPKTYSKIRINEAFELIKKKKS